jgi:hypothetical protein
MMLLGAVCILCDVFFVECFLSLQIGPGQSYKVETSCQRILPSYCRDFSSCKTFRAGLKLGLSVSQMQTNTKQCAMFNVAYSSIMMHLAPGKVCLPLTDLCPTYEQISVPDLRPCCLEHPGQR